MHEQADGRHRAGRHPTALARNLVQHLAPPSELGVGQELLPHVLGVRRDELARVAVYRDNAPALGEGKHVRQHVDRMLAISGVVHRLSCSSMTYRRFTAARGSLPSAGTMDRHGLPPCGTMPQPAAGPYMCARILTTVLAVDGLSSI